MELEMIPQRPGETSRDYAYRLLRGNIMTLRLCPGTVIKEAELSSRLNMSRTPIHEAVAALKEEWLVEVAPQSGTKVTLIDPTLMKEGYNARLLLESDLLREASGKLGRTQGRRLLECLKEQEAVGAQCCVDAEDFIRLDDAMHRLMYEFSGRARTWHAIRGLVSHYDRARYLDAIAGKMNVEKILYEHHAFYNYLLMGLPPEVDPVEKMALHLSAFRGDFWEDMKEYRVYFAL